MAIDGYDVLFALGFIALAVGLWWVYPPAAMITCGALLMGLALFGVRRKA